MATAATTMTAAAHDRYAGIFTQSSSASAPTSSISGTTTNDSVTNNSNNTMTMIVSPGFETQSLLSSIYAVPVDEIGSNKFMAAYCVNLERLSVQAHWTAGVIAASQMNTVAVNNNGNGEATSTMMATPGLGDVLSSLTGVGGIMGGSNDEEFIVEAFLENVDKLEALVKTLLALELWRENVLFDGWNKRKEDAVIEEEEEEVEFEVEGGERDECNELNEVDGGEEDVVDTTNVETTRKGLAWRLADNGNALRTAFILHAETTIVSLLSLIFYKGIPAGLLEGSLGDEMLLSLIDYCARQLIFLGSPEESNPALSRQKNPLPAPQLSAYLQTRSRMDEIRDSVYDSTYQTAIASVPLSRYLCENVNDLGPSLLSRMLEMHDFPLLMVPLIEEPPWTRRRMIEKPGGGGPTKMMWEKLDEHNEWKEVPPTNLLQLTKLEGQPWLALFHLTTSKVCREAYGLDEYRKSQLMRVRKYLHETLMDQLPVLGDVARYLDELSILGVPPSGQGIHRPSSSASSSGLLLQRVDVLRESIVGKRSMGDSEYWEGIAASQWESIFSCVTDSKDEELRRIAAEVYGGDVMEDDVVNASIDASRFDVQKEEPQSADEDWKVALSKPIERVLLSIKDNSNNILASFELAPVQNGGGGATSETPLGTFQRLKLSISQTSGDGDAIFPLARAVACIQFQGEPSPTGPNNEVELCIDSLQLTAVEHSMSQNTYDEVGIALPENWPKKEWRQIGDLESKSVVLQLGFKRLSRGMVPAGSTLLRGYTLSQAFLSQPCAAS